MSISKHKEISLFRLSPDDFFRPSPGFMGSGLFCFLLLVSGFSFGACAGSDDRDDGGTPTDGATTDLASDGNLSPEEDATPDRVAPVFGGLSEVIAGENSILLRWNAAADDRDKPEKLIYDIFISLESGRQDFVRPPLASTPPGALFFQVNSLPKDGPYYFVVRARDRAGNREENSVEKIGWTIQVRFVSPEGKGLGLSSEDPAGDLQTIISDMGKFTQTKVYVSEGSYTGPFVLVHGVELLGGFSADFQERDIAVHPTVLRGNGQADVDVVKAANSTTIDGFIITGAVGEGVGINAYESSPVISRNRITLNSRSGIYLGGYKGPSNPQIFENTIDLNGYAECAHEEMPLQEEPITVVLGARLYPCGGIYALGFWTSVNTIIQDNRIENNQGYGISFDAFYTGIMVTATRNLISGNSYSGIRTRIEGDQGIFPTFAFNADLLHNAVTRNGLNGIELLATEGGYNMSIVRNNLVAFNRNLGMRIDSVGYMGYVMTEMGVQEFFMPSESSPTLTNNIILANALDGINIYSHGEEVDPNYAEPARPGSANTEPLIHNNTVIGNRLAGISQLAELGGWSTPELLNSIIAFNGADLDGISSSYCDVRDEDPPLDQTNLCVDPGFVHTPVSVDFTAGIGTNTSVPVDDLSLYAAGEYLEINGDGVARKIDSIDEPGKSLQFSPALESPAGAESSILGWPTDDIHLDFQLLDNSASIDAGNPDPAFDDRLPPGMKTRRNDLGAYGGPHAGQIP